MKTLTFALVLFCASSALAQPAPRGRAAFPQAGADLSPGEVQRLFDAYVTVQAQDVLKLTDEQYPQFVARLKALQETRRRTQAARQQVLQELARMTMARGDAAVDENGLRERLAQLQEIESRGAAETRRAYDALDQVLDVRQRARFRVFEEQIERRKLELIQRARASRQPQRKPQ